MILPALLLTTLLTRGSVRELSMRAPSLGGGARSVRVYLPPSYDTAEAGARRYPTVYLLHGWPGGPGNWFGSGRAAVTADSMIASHRMPELIMVCPDGAGPGFMGRSLYIDSHDGSMRMEDYIVHDVVAWVDSTFRTRRDPAARALAGLSDGGSAAVNLAFKHPDVFGGCASLSGNFRLDTGAGTGHVLGPEPGRSRIVDENSPVLYAPHIAERLRGLTIYFDCGVDDEALHDNREFHQVLQSLGIPHEFHEFPGSHGWSYWRSHIRDALIAVTARWVPGS